MSSRRLSILALPSLAAAFCCMGAQCLGDGDAAGVFLPPGDNEAVCQTISPGNEIAVQVGVRGRALKLNWVFTDCVLDLTGEAEKLTLVARNAADGYVMGDSDATFMLRIENEEGLATGDYRDSPRVRGQQGEHFDVAISSNPSINAVSTGAGAGEANILEFRRTGSRVTTRIAFTGPMLNLVDNTLENVCGEAFFDGQVTVKE